MKPITSDQLAVLVAESSGRAFSWVDEPDWYCGQRRCTFAARDGVTELVPTPDGQWYGTMQSLAYSMRDHCADYQRAVSDARFARSQMASIDSEKTKSKRKLEALARERSIYYRDAANADKRAVELRAKYFVGYEARFLLSDQ